MSSSSQPARVSPVHSIRSAADKRRGARTRIGRAGTSVSLAVAMIVTVVVGAASSASGDTYPITWTADSAPFPADAAAHQGGSLTGLSCPAVGWCVSIGDYDTASGPGQDGEGLIAVESSGGFKSVSAPLPADASTTNPDVSLTDVSCGAVGACAVVGWYMGQDQLTHGLIVTLASGSWSAADVPMPPNAGGPKPWDGAQLAYVTCPSADPCVATGTYTDTTGNLYSVVDTGAGGNWNAMGLPFGESSFDTVVPVVACPTVDFCVVAGEGDADILSNGTWSLSSTSVDAASVSCDAPGDCAAVGGTWPTVGSLATLSGDVWTTVATPLPADAVSPPEATVLSVSCGDTGSCVAVGYYQVQPTASQVFAGFIDTLSGGTWTSVPAPSTDPSDVADEVLLTDVTCPAAGQCVAAGFDARGGAVYENQDGDGWVPTPAPVPGFDPAGGGAIYLTNLSCPGVGACADGLTATSRDDNSTLFIEIDPSLPPTTTQLSVAPTTPMTGQAVTLSTSVSAPGLVPTGTVSFWTGLTNLCSTALSDGKASCEIPSWPGDAVSVGVSFSGDSSVAPSSDSTVFPLQIGTASLPPATVKVMYSATLTAGGGNLPYKWSLQSGRLPPGLHLTPSGEIMGTPRRSGTFTFEIKVTSHRSKGHPPGTATQAVSMTVT